MIIDTHAHLMFDQFKGEVEKVIENARNVGVERIINTGCNKETSIQAHEMSLRYKGLYATIGIHPHDAKEITEDLMKDWAQLIRENIKIVAIGECGLDYVKSKVSKEDQKKAFKMQMELAREVGLPVVIHNREADEDTMEILKEFDGKDGKRRVEAVFHCYGSNVEFARQLWYNRYLTSFTGTITYPKNEEIIKVLEEVPMDSFMVETDCPYLAPQKYRGERNEPAYVLEVLEKFAEIRHTSVEEVARISTENTEEFFFRMNQ